MGQFALDDKGSQNKSKQAAEQEQSSTATQQNTDQDASLNSSQSSSFETGQLQRTAGNAAIQRLAAHQNMSLQQKSDGQTALDDDTAAAIQQEKGKGFAPDAAVTNPTSSVTQSDYSDVKIHTDAKADQLSRQLGAKAFTVGEDIYFRSGEYSPGSQDGQKLLSHELTHVTQQQQGAVSDGGPQAKMTVTAADDQFEKEADNVADAVAAKAGPESVSASGEAVQRETIPEEGDLQMQRDASGEAVQREAMPEEDDLQMQRDTVQREEASEEEMLQG